MTSERSSDSSEFHEPDPKLRATIDNVFSSSTYIVCSKTLPLLLLIMFAHSCIASTVNNGGL